MKPTKQEIENHLNYNSETGIFTRINSHGRNEWTPDDTGYLRISVKGKQYHIHRLAWVCYYGEWQPEGMEIDHINGDKLDNRIANLRLATRGQNATNALAQKSSKIGLRGVHYHKGAKRYRAQLQSRGKVKSLGYFDTPEEAHSAYLKAAKEIHGPFVRE